MKINIIGSGWLALPLARHLSQSGHQLMVTATGKPKSQQLNASGIKCIQYRLGEQLINPSLLFDTDVLIIAITHKELSDFIELINQLSKQHCQHLLYISSTSVYLNNGQTHDESSTALNQNSTVLKIEQSITQHPSASIIRFAGLVGPKRHPGRFFANGKPIKNPDTPVNLIHLDDCISTISAIIDQQAWNQTFNACADTHPMKYLFYQSMANSLGLPKLSKQDSSNNEFKIIDNNKIKEQLNIKLIHPDVMKMTF